MTGDIATHADVAVVGAGAIGASVALWLARRGAAVVVIERGDGWGTQCSLGNAGWICPSHAGPFARPGEVMQALRWLTRDDTPFAIMPDVRLVPWLLRLTRATNGATVARVTEQTARWARESLLLHRELAADGIDTGFRQDGLIDVYSTKKAWANAQRRAEYHARLGSRVEVLTGAQTVAMEPTLAPSISGAIRFAEDAHCDPAKFTTGVGAAAEALGTRMLIRREATDIVRASNGLKVICRDLQVRAGAVVVATGAGTAALSRSWGEKVHVVAGKGYSIDLALPDGAPRPRQPLMLSEARVAVTPFDKTVRLAGTMEIGGRLDRVAQARLVAIEQAGRSWIPALAGERATPSWQGLRPCTPDGLPLIRRSSTMPGMVVATGHAMLGITLAPVTGRLVADLLDR